MLSNSEANPGRWMGWLTTHELYSFIIISYYCYQIQSLKDIVLNFWDVCLLAENASHTMPPRPTLCPPPPHVKLRYYGKRPILKPKLATPLIYF